MDHKVHMTYNLLYILGGDHMHQICQSLAPVPAVTSWDRLGNLADRRLKLSFCDFLIEIFCHQELHYVRVHSKNSLR